MPASTSTAESEPINLWNPLRRALWALCRAGAPVSLTAFSFVGLGAVMTHQPLVQASLVSVVAIGVASYLLDRGLDSPLGVNAKLVSAAIVLYGVSAVSTLHAGHHLLFLLGLVGFPLAVVIYGSPVLPFARIRRVKDIPYAKTLYVALLWGLLSVTGAGFHPSQRSTFWFFAAYVAVWVFCGSVLSDVKDIKEDERSGTKTLPSTLGPRRTFALLHLMNLGIFAAVAWAVAAHIAPGWLMIIELRALIFAGYLAYAGRHLDRVAIFSELGLDLISAMMVPVWLLAR